MNKLYICIIVLIVMADLINSLKENDHKQLNTNFYNGQDRHITKRKIETFDNLQRYSFRDLPCSCYKLVCSCCVTLKIPLVNSTNTCTNITFFPSDFTAEISVLVGNITFSRNISAKNPPAACIPVPYIPLLDACLHLKDLQIRNSTFHACVDVEAKISAFKILVLHFDCLEISTNGIELSKPKTSSVQKVEGKIIVLPYEIKVPYEIEVPFT